MTDLTDDLLNEYLDDTLDAGTRAAVTARLAVAPAARARLARLEALFADLDHLPDLPEPRDFSAGVLSAIQPLAFDVPSVVRWLLPLQAAMALVALAVVGVVFWPVYASTLPDLPQVAIIEQAQQAVALASAQAATRWASLSMQAQQFFAGGDGFGGIPGLDSISLGLALGAAALAGLAWLLGSSLIIRSALAQPTETPTQEH